MKLEPKSQFKRWLGFGGASLLVIALGIALWLGSKLATTGAGLIAKQLCSLVYVSGLDANAARALYLRPLVGSLHGQFSHELLSEPLGVEVKGLTQSATALYRPGYGCTLVNDAEQTLALTEVITINHQVEGVDVQMREQHFDPSALEAALANAFAEPTKDKPRQTLAIAIRYQGALVAEAYAPGIAPTTALPGWSMAKSVTTTLAGVMAQQGLVSVADSQLFEAWSSSDNRSKMSLDNLLRMTSGLDLEETGSGIDANSSMLFHTTDAAAYALDQGVAHLPNEHWHYSGGSTLLAAKYLTDKAGGTQAMYQTIRQLFDSLGMHSAVLEPDASGTFLGSSFMLASARDWSKLGQLYLAKGIWNGERLLPEGWTEYVTTKTTLADPLRRYGAGFWLANDPGLYSQHSVPALPPDTFSAHGMQNQAMHIVPSEDLVVVRMGATRDYWASGEWNLVADIIAAKR